MLRKVFIGKILAMINHAVEILRGKPAFGLVSALLSMNLTHLQVLQIIGAVLGIIIAVVTAILKVIELKDRLEGKKKTASPARKKKPTTED